VKKNLPKKADELRRELDLVRRLVTRIEESMSLYRNGEAIHEPTVARETFEVFGAGDRIIPTGRLILIVDEDTPEATKQANRAADIVVGNVDTAGMQREELFG
jgi:D-glycero-beta-D-manno-heptose-7-phosphate kinase